MTIAEIANQHEKSEQIEKMEVIGFRTTGGVDELSSLKYSLFLFRDKVKSLLNGKTGIDLLMTNRVHVSKEA